HEPRRYPEDPLRGFGGPVEGRDQRVLLVIAGDEFRLAGVAPGFGGVPGCRRNQRRWLDVERRSGFLLDHLPGEVERNRVEPRHAAALFDTRLRAAPLIGVLHGPEAFPRVLRPPELPS